MSKKAWIIIAIETIVAITLIGLIWHNRDNKIDILETNISAYRDSIAVVELKNGELLASKQSLILSESQALDELNMTKKELKSLKKELDSKIAQINKLTSEINVSDTIYMKQDTVFVCEDYTIKTFKWWDEWTTLNAKIEGNFIADADLTIYNLKMNLPIEFGVTDDYKVWVKTPNPNVTFKDISSVTIYGSSIYPKQKRLHHGIHVGVGPVYGIFNKNFDLGIAISYGLTFSL